MSISCVMIQFRLLKDLENPEAIYTILIGTVSPINQNNICY
jgi:hypothetical protein